MPVNRVNQSYQPLQASPSPQNPSVPELREKQEQVSLGSCRKKVTFDLNVTTYEDVAVREDIEDPLEVEDVEEEARREVERKVLENEDKVSSGSSYRYQNCESSDDEGIDDDGGEEEYDDSDLDDDEVAVVGTEEESYESFFSLPMDKEKQQDSCEEVNSPMPVGVPAKGGARDRSQYVHPVLNPVENLSQWKEVKLGMQQSKNPTKENICNKLNVNIENPDKENSGFEFRTKLTGFSPEPKFKARKLQKPTDSTPNHSASQDISVDASLSTWLVSSENSRKEETPQGGNSRWSNSSVSREDQPILGALTVEDLKQSSVTSSPRRSPSRNPDEIPILGTVGSYWNTRDQNSDTKGIPNSTSKYREDKRVNWHSTPFEVRLERALNKEMSC